MRVDTQRADCVLDVETPSIQTNFAGDAADLKIRVHILQAAYVIEAAKR